MREWLTGLLPDSPARDDLISVAVELGTNAIQHTASGNGGWFTVEITSLSPLIRVSVTDEGAASEPCLTEDPLSEHGRGLIIVNALSVTSGVCGNASGRTVWAEIAQVTPALAGQGLSSRPPASSAMAISRTL
ncbi:MAG TPA: ATP-binding protein [Streptosporangiaceae bacterium]|nr:ATP-binding protein [Streptosporangiaceae bacterium]